MGEGSALLRYFDWLREREWEAMVEGGGHFYNTMAGRRRVLDSLCSSELPTFHYRHTLGLRAALSRPGGLQMPTTADLACVLIRHMLAQVM